MCWFLKIKTMNVPGTFNEIHWNGIMHNREGNDRLGLDSVQNIIGGTYGQQVYLYFTANNLEQEK